MNFILRISNEIKLKVQVALLEVSLMDFFLEYGQKEGENGVTRSIIDELHSSDIQRDLKEGESDVTRSITDELHSWDIQRDQREGESSVTRSMIDELRSSDI